MFNHIRKIHPDELLKNTTRKWLDDAESGKPLKVYWTTKDDFDEEHITAIYVCLSTNKTFVSAQKAEDHFKKDKAALKDHNKQIKDLKKQHAKFRKDKAKQDAKTNPRPAQHLRMYRENNPVLARMIWRGILHHKAVMDCCKLICMKRNFNEEKPMYLWDDEHMMNEQVTYEDFMIKHEFLVSRFNDCLESQCLNTKTLNALWFELHEMWRRNYRESVPWLFEELKYMKENFDAHFEGNTDMFYGYATEDMEGVSF